VSLPSARAVPAKCSTEHHERPPVSGRKGTNNTKPTDKQAMLSAKENTHLISELDYYSSSYFSMKQYTQEVLISTISCSSVTQKHKLAQAAALRIASPTAGCTPSRARSGFCPRIRRPAMQAITPILPATTARSAGCRPTGQWPS